MICFPSGEVRRAPRTIVVITTRIRSEWATKIVVGLTSGGGVNSFLAGEFSAIVFINAIVPKLCLGEVQMGNRKQLKQVAVDIAARDMAAIAELEADRKELAAKLAELETRIKAAHNALDRARKFSQSHGGEMICPVCLVRGNKKVRLHSVDSPSDEYALLECRDCHQEFEVELA